MLFKFRPVSGEVLPDSIEVLDQLLRHRLFPAQHPTKIGTCDAEQLGELVPPANLFPQPPQLRQRLLLCRADRIGLLTQSLRGAEELHQGSVGDPLALAQAGKRVTGDLRLFEQSPITDVISLLDVEDRGG